MVCVHDFHGLGGRTHGEVLVKLGIMEFGLYTIETDSLWMNGMECRKDVK